MGQPFPGKYGWKYHPWVREILDSKAEFNVMLKSAQAGLTEVGINRALYTIDVCKRDVLYVLPTATNAADFSKARFGGALANSDYLKSLFTSTNTVGLKQAGATNLYIRGSRGDSNLKSVPASVLIMDERDEFDQRAVELALERLSGQTHKEVWSISTPTIPNYGVSGDYLSTTQEEFHFQCPHCNKHTHLIYPDCLEVVGDTVNDPRIKESFIKCKECQHKLEHQDKPNWLKKAYWHKTYDNGDPSRRGFHINQFYSFTVSPPEIAVGHLKAQTDEYARTEFYNSKLGLPFLGDAAKVNEDQIERAMRAHSINDPRPANSSRLITLGIDQGRTGYLTVVEWFINDKYDPFAECLARVLYFEKFDQNASGYSAPSQAMPEWQVRAAVTDADPDISLARAFARKFWGHAWMSRYRKGVTGNEMSLSDEEVAPIATVDRTYWISQVTGLFKRGCIELPVETTNEFKSHMMNVVAKWEKDESGNPYQTFVSTGADHFLHSLVYAAIAVPLGLKTFTAAKDI